MNDKQPKKITPPPFLAFAEDEASLAILKKFALDKEWEAGCIQKGTIETATAFLAKNPSPAVLFIDIPPESSKIEGLLNALADVCNPNIKVIVSGTINEYSFYCWLIEAGISSYLLKPFTINMLATAYEKASETPQKAEKTAEAGKQVKVISVIGSRGGAGTTTLCVNLAWLLANKKKQKTALFDFDPQLGTLALELDLDAGKGMKEAIEKPDRIDSLFVDRVMVRLDENLSLLSSEEPLEETISFANDMAAQALLKQAKTKFSHIIIDLPRHLSPLSRYALANSTTVICVTEYTMAGLRDSLRYLEYCRDILKIPAPLFIANKVGIAGKHQMSQAEFEKGLGVPILFNIPFSSEIYDVATSGEVLVEHVKQAAASKVFQEIANHLSDAQADKKEKSGLFSFLKGK